MVDPEVTVQIFALCSCTHRAEVALKRLFVDLYMFAKSLVS
jgi:hypothetical protein